ncbi:DUF190 domain-containing protein [Legionella spiritensis]|uniref:Uncharacterized protein n=1 Tax=Legionella spiritensis TaxID=452 RepID=A0A0W0Z9U6_LEGSP|nr:DUF190 domain-containing protein [Legionella spiritensis]KTD65873.1 hypothetical protein Lspi_0292 [Legionella spiritensis]SNV32120.1 Uncharacterized ACR, COG1993 [Legionella spiritensis]VEG92224.1 Uncharacterized ACR, COG1993 [Legionella spiritensis]
MNVKIVRFYLSEDSPFLHQVYDYLHEHRVMGATLFRGVKGFGHSGKERQASLLDIHFDLPMIVEFFDEPAKVDEILNHFSNIIEPYRILSWTAWMGAD